MSSTTPNLKFKTPESQKEFIKTLRSRVDEYFKLNNTTKHANGAMVFKTLFIFAGMGLSYAAILTEFLGLTFLWWPLLGFFTAMCGLNIGHDAIHGSYSKSPFVNKWLSYSFNLIGANAYLWNIAHNVVHHSFTNIPDVDEDLEGGVVLRLSPTQERNGLHKYQHLYAFFLYGLASLVWVFHKDYKKFHKGQIGNKSFTPPAVEYVKLYGFKMLHLAIYLAIPLYVLDQSVGFIIAGFLLMHYVEGFFMAVIFMLAHVVEGTSFPEPTDQGSVENSWAVHQLYTTADFARKNPLLTFLAGGLNYQVEHHLFPNICHIHYPALSNIVEKTAKEFGHPYLDNPSFFGALKSHARFLKAMGNTN